jgi:Sulfatase-modifying factor enzyme 1
VLLKTWDKLKRWLEKEREFLVWRGEADARRKEYEDAGKEGARRQRQALLMGLPLDTAEKWLSARRGDIGRETQAFIEASLREDRKAARNRQRLYAAVGVLMLGVIASLLGVIFKDKIGEFWFEQTTLRRYIAMNFKDHVLKPEAERALKPGGPPFRECAKDCPEMVVLPAGSFRMGSPDSEARRSRDEGPVRTVTIAKPFAVGKFEVTWDDWEACVAMRGCDGRPTGDSGWGKGQVPVINVSWQQAKAYVTWLSRMTGKPYRLLTEAEWEYAARGVTSADAPHPPYPWGDKASHEYANYGTDQCCQGQAEGRDKWV